MLPTISGVNLCQYRSQENCSRADAHRQGYYLDKVTGLDAGADYLVKPVDVVELLARVRALDGAHPLWKGDTLIAADLSSI